MKVKAPKDHYWRDEIFQMVDECCKTGPLGTYEADAAAGAKGGNAGEAESVQLQPEKGPLSPRREVADGDDRDGGDETRTFWGLAAAMKALKTSNHLLRR